MPDLDYIDLIKLRLLDMREGKMEEGEDIDRALELISLDMWYRCRNWDEDSSVLAGLDEMSIRFELEDEFFEWYRAILPESELSKPAGKEDVLRLREMLEPKFEKWRAEKLGDGQTDWPLTRPMEEYLAMPVESRGGPDDKYRWVYPTR